MRSEKEIKDKLLSMTSSDPYYQSHAEFKNALRWVLNEQSNNQDVIQKEKSAIRFIDLTNDTYNNKNNKEFKFIYYNIVTNQILSFNNKTVWSSWEEFETDFNADNDNKFEDDEEFAKLFKNIYEITFKSDDNNLLSDIRMKLNDYSFIHKSFIENIKHGDYDSYSPNYKEMKENGWYQAMKFVLSLLS
jgi:hypothetical protein